MLFISCYRGYQLTIQPDQSQMVVRMDRAGMAVPMTVQRLLIAKFALQPIPYAARYQALDFFMQKGGFEDEGAIVHYPQRKGGIATDVGVAGISYQGFDPEFFFSSFDTETWSDEEKGGGLPVSMVDTNDEKAVRELRELFERRLLDARGNGDFGRDFILYEPERIPAPWPTYDTLIGGGMDKRILLIVREGGFDPAAVLAYEEQNRARAGVMRGLREMMGERQIEAGEQEALSTVVS